MPCEAMYMPSGICPRTGPVFINDLPDNIRSPVRLFADTYVLYSEYYLTKGLSNFAKRPG